MPVVAVVIGIAIVLWAFVLAHRGSILIACGVVLIVGYVFGHEFWHASVGPFPITLDRLALLLVIGMAAIAWRFGRWSFPAAASSDWLLGATIAILVGSALLSGEPNTTSGESSKWGRLLTSFLLPAMLYAVVRAIPITRREWCGLLTLMVALGVYLAITALCEVAGFWSLVLPRYIANPELGIHFGRARGPALNSVSLGIYLTACLSAAWILVGFAQRRWQQLALLLTIPLMALAVLLTYTRSTWIGLAGAVLVIAAIQIPRHLRTTFVTVGMLLGLFVVGMSWTQLAGLEREGSAEESSHSVSQRTSFAYVSWQMFRDHPIAGVGFGRFYDRKMPYLSDRSQDFELESIRTLHHHHTLLSILTETGLVGLSFALFTIVAWCLSAWAMINDADLPAWTSSCGVLFFAILTSYACSAMFHDLTLLPSQHLLLFMFAGIIVNLRQDRASARVIRRIELRTPDPSWA